MDSQHHFLHINCYLVHVLGHYWVDTLETGHKCALLFLNSGVHGLTAKDKENYHCGKFLREIETE